MLVLSVYTVVPVEVALLTGACEALENSSGPGSGSIIGCTVFQMSKTKLPGHLRVLGGQSDLKAAQLGAFAEH